MTQKFIDLNCDMGEDFGNYLISKDEQLLQLVSSANIACGFHAGDASVMHRTVLLAIKYNVAIGAHPGLPDLQGFGRRAMAITPQEAYDICLYQLGALDAFVKVAGGKLHHIKPHGALYNMAAENAELAESIVKATADYDRSLLFYGLANSKFADACASFRIRFVAEAFSDRTYTANGRLTPRSQHNALVESESASLQQVLSIVKDGSVIATDGSSVSLAAETVCIHGDGKHALSFAQNLKTYLQQEGITIQPPPAAT